MCGWVLLNSGEIAANVDVTLHWSSTNSRFEAHGATLSTRCDDRRDLLGSHDANLASIRAHEDPRTSQARGSASASGELVPMKGGRLIGARDDACGLWLASTSWSGKSHQKLVLWWLPDRGAQHGLASRNLPGRCAGNRTPRWLSMDGAACWMSA
jgi:hypothetical protein